MKIDRKLIYSTGLGAFLFSYLIHNPSLQGALYSDIVSFWYRLLELRSRIPYFDFGFEYPPLSGLVTYISAFAEDLINYYTIFSILILIFYLILIEVTSRIASERGVGLEFLVIFLALSPSMILFMVYNFDVIFAALLVSSIYFFTKNRYFLSAIFFSLTALAKLVNLILLPFFLMRIKDRRSRIMYAVISLGFLTAVNLVIWALNPKFIDETYLYLVRWGLENAWFIALFPNEASWDTAKIFSAFLLCYGLLKVYLCDSRDIYVESFMVLSVFLLTSYIFTPQMAIWLLPLLAIMGRIPYSYYLFDFSNAAIILTWFQVSDPVKFGSIPQNFAIMRAVLLFIMLLEVYYGSKRVMEVAPEVRFSS
ncbi:MAG: glycosyltransferase 87 family protein [Nitrososphaerota archaeon]|nr:glycosyltransferase 87 family protein [Nitrososphaerota archaeon]